MFLVLCLCHPSWSSITLTLLATVLLPRGRRRHGGSVRHARAGTYLLHLLLITLTTYYTYYLLHLLLITLTTYYTYYLLHLLLHLFTAHTSTPRLHLIHIYFYYCTYLLHLPLHLLTLLTSLAQNPDCLVATPGRLQHILAESQLGLTRAPHGTPTPDETSGLAD